MRSCPPGWATDLAILEHTGSLVQDHGDHLVVRTPANPDFHWGNFLLVTDDAAVDDADRWVAAFRAALPEATWVAIGLPRMPEARDAWLAHGIGSSSRRCCRHAPSPAGRRCPRATRCAGSPATTGTRTWRAPSRRTSAAGRRTRPRSCASRGAQLQARQDLSARDLGAWFGAFADGALVADLGIVRCGTTARYQDVTTEEEHRGRGLASHLLGVAAHWAAEGGCEQWVIVTGATNPAGRVYRSLGFEPDTGTVQAYRRPPG